MPKQNGQEVINYNDSQQGSTSNDQKSHQNGGDTLPADDQLDDNVSDQWSVDIEGSSNAKNEADEWINNA